MTPDQVRRHLRALNPVTDDSTLDFHDVSSNALIDSLTTRRSNMSSVNRSDTVADSRLRRPRVLAIALGAVLVVSLGAIGAVLLSNDGADVAAPTSGLDTAEQYVALRTAGDTIATLELMTPAAVEEETNFMHALEVWNIRGTQVTPCRENRNGDYECELTEDNDFLKAVGLSPWTATFTLEVNADHRIERVGTSTDIFPAINTFWVRFAAWMDQAHPGDSARMEGSLSGGSINGEGAQIALDYIDEFVAASEAYP